MADFFSPLWEYIFEKFGSSGIFLVTVAPFVLIVLALIAIIIVINIIRAIIKGIINANIKSLRKKAKAYSEAAQYSKAHKCYMRLNKKGFLKPEDEFDLYHICKAEDMDDDTSFAYTKEYDCMYWLKRSADNKLPVAMFELGIIYSTDYKKDPLKSAKGVALIKEASNSGLKEASQRVRDIEEGLRGLCTESRAAMGDAVSQFELCKELMEKNVKIAIEWGKLAADQGHEKAQNIVGAVYAFGHGVKPDMEYGMEMLERSAKQGSADSQCKLGYLYRGECGVKRDDNKAVYWFEMAHKQGVADATYSLGLIYGLQSQELRERKGLTKLEALHDKEVMRLYHKSQSLIEEAANAGSQAAKTFLNR